MKRTWVSVVLIAIIFFSASAGALDRDTRDDALMQFFANYRTQIEKIADDPAAMKEYVLSQKDVNGRYKNGQTLLHFAANRGHADVVALLLKKGAHINAQDNDGRTPLHEAMSYSRIEVVRLLVANGADVNLKNKDGDTPLISVIFMDNKKLAVDLVNLFLEKGWDISTSADARLLNETIGRRHPDIARILLKKGVKYDDRALVAAARIGYEDIFAILLSKGANPGQKGIIGAACQSGNLAILKTLVEKGQEPTADDIESAVYMGHRDAAMYLNTVLKKAKGQEVDIRKRCYLKPDPGPCKALFESAYYDPNTKKCVRSFYGGCEGESPFDSVEACRNVCE